MRRLVLIFVAMVAGCAGQGGYEPRNGDIVFQVSRSTQSRAIQLATKSPYSHMGVVYLIGGAPFVFEAVQPVKLTPLGEWITQGAGGRFVAKRLRDGESVLSSETLQRMMEIGKNFAGRDYDLYFEWSDDRLYCSELVWKIFERGAGIEIGDLAKLGEFDLSHPEVHAKIGERFGGEVPLGETVVSPAAMFASSKLRTVYKN